jgi:hypothetical protein
VIPEADGGRGVADGGRQDHVAPADRWTPGADGGNVAVEAGGRSLCSGAVPVRRFDPGQRRPQRHVHRRRGRAGPGAAQSRRVRQRPARRDPHHRGRGRHPVRRPAPAASPSPDPRAPAAALLLDDATSASTPPPRR